jgi:hypothetical protein
MISYYPEASLSKELLEWFHEHDLVPLVNVIFQRFKEFDTPYHSDHAIPQPVSAINFQIEGTAIHTFYNIKNEVSTIIDTAKKYERKDLELVDTLVMKDNSGYLVKVEVPHHVKATSKFRAAASIRFRHVSGRVLSWQELLAKFA